jgi:hypothetical protein
VSFLIRRASIPFVCFASILWTDVTVVRAGQPPRAHGDAAPATGSGRPARNAAPSIVRDDQGRATITATQLPAPLRLDGRIDEPIYDRVVPISDFVQTEPDAGQPASERTDVWVFFDAEAIYVTMRAWESEPTRMVANEMRRDSGNIRQGDSVAFSFDTFYDRRSAIHFEMNVLGGRTDGQSTNERQFNPDWNPVWALATGRFEGGWIAETAIPFKSIRYAPGRAQIWGFNARRINKWKNEVSNISRIPPSFGLRGGLVASLYATPRWSASRHRRGPGTSRSSPTPSAI